MLLRDASVSLGELFQPFFTVSHFEGAIVLPIGQCAIKVVSLDKFCKFLAASEAIGAAAVRELVVSEGTHKYSHSVVVVFLSETGLDFLGS